MNMSQSSEISKILAVPESNRDSHWEIHFFQAIVNSKLNVLSPDPQTGPDSWPYLMVEVTQDGQDSFQTVLQWLYNKGIGLVINPLKPTYPDFVFPYGMLWHFRETGWFYKNNQIKSTTPQVHTLDVQTSEQWKMGPPTEEFLPQYVRKILREFLRDQGVLNPRILMLSQSGEYYDLAFSIESLGNPEEKEHQGILEALSWFLPPHYSLALVKESQLVPFNSL